MKILICIDFHLPFTILLLRFKRFKSFDDCFNGFLFFFGRGDGFSLRQFGGGFVGQGDVNRKVIAADIRHSSEFGEPKMIRVKNVIEGKTNYRIMRVKRTVETSADPRVEQPTDFLEKSRRPRLGDIVQVAGDDRRRVRLFDNFPD